MSQTRIHTEIQHTECMQPELYKSGMAAMMMGAEAGPQMTPECAVVKMMQCLHYRDIPLGVPLAGEM
jgi:L-asparaginase